MKKFNLLLSAVALAFAFISCNPEVKTPVNPPEPESNELTDEQKKSLELYNRYLKDSQWLSFAYSDGSLTKNYEEKGGENAYFINNEYWASYNKDIDKIFSEDLNKAFLNKQKYEPENLLTITDKYFNGDTIYKLNLKGLDGNPYDEGFVDFRSDDEIIIFTAFERDKLYGSTFRRVSGGSGAGQTGSQVELESTTWSYTVSGRDITTNLTFNSDGSFQVKNMSTTKTNGGTWSQSGSKITMEFKADGVITTDTFTTSKDSSGNLVLTLSGASTTDAAGGDNSFERSFGLQLMFSVLGTSITLSSVN